MSNPHSEISSILSSDTNRILQGLERVTSLMVDAHDPRNALERIGLVLTDVLHANRWSIMLKTELDVIRISLAKGLPQQVIDQTSIKLGDGIAGRVAQRGQAQLYKNVEYEVGLCSGGQYGSASAICVPIVLKGDVRGVINLSDKLTESGIIGEFNEHDLTLALMTANQAAMVLEMLHSVDVARGRERSSRGEIAPDAHNAELVAQASAFDLISRVTDLMTISGDLDQVLVAAINGACFLVGATRGSLMLYDKEHGELRIRADMGMPADVVDSVRVKPGQGIAGRVLTTGDALLLTNAARARLGNAEHADAQASQYRNHSALSVPLKIRGQVLGVININDRSDQNDFSENDLYIARVIANHAAVAISAAHLLRESVAAAEMQRLLDLAHDIQANLLPTLPRVNGLDVAGLSDPCASAGGDYIDYFLASGACGTSPDCLYLACGDVSGHGVGSALIMAMGRAFLRALMRQDTDLAAVMHQMNELIEADTPAGQFMTLFAGMLDVAHGTLCYASAGHDPALLYRPTTGRIVETESTGLPLGMFEHQHYWVEKLTIQSGDVLVLSTDGIAEATNPRGIPFGRDRLKDTIRALSEQPAEQIAQAIKQRVLDFSYPQALQDDLSIIVAKIL